MACCIHDGPARPGGEAVRMATLSGRQREVLGFLAERDWTLGVAVADSIGGLERTRTYGDMAILQGHGFIEARWVHMPETRMRREVRITDAGRAALTRTPGDGQ